MDVELKHKEQKSEIDTSKFHLFMLSSNGTIMVRLIAMNLR